MFWKSISAVEKIFKDRAVKAKLPYYTPHSFRRLNVEYARKFAGDMEVYSAVSQNLGHSNIGITDGGYGQFEPERRCEILSKMRFDKSPEELKTDESSILHEIHDIVKKMKPKNNK